MRRTGRSDEGHSRVLVGSELQLGRRTVAPEVRHKELRDRQGVRRMVVADCGEVHHMGTAVEHHTLLEVRHMVVADCVEVHHMGAALVHRTGPAEVADTGCEVVLRMVVAVAEDTAVDTGPEEDIPAAAGRNLEGQEDHLVEERRNLVEVGSLAEGTVLAVAVDLLFQCQYIGLAAVKTSYYEEVLRMADNRPGYKTCKHDNPDGSANSSFALWCCRWQRRLMYA